MNHGSYKQAAPKELKNTHHLPTPAKQNVARPVKMPRQGNLWGWL